MNAIEKYISNMKHGWNPPKSGRRSNPVKRENLSPRQRAFSAQYLDRVDKKARRFIMRPMINAPGIRFRKLGWVSPHPLSEKEKRLSTTGFVELPTGKAVEVK